MKSKILITLALALAVVIPAVTTAFLIHPSPLLTSGREGIPTAAKEARAKRITVGTTASTTSTARCAIDNDNDESDQTNPSDDEEHHPPLPKDGQRRKAILGAATSLPFLFGNHRNSVASASSTTAMPTEQETLIADLPMRRLKLPGGGLGREYVIVQLYIGNEGPYDFMVDSGLTTELVTPHLQHELHLDKSSGITKQGLSAGQVSQTQSLIELNDVSLCCGTFAGGAERFALPGPLHAIVTDFPQEHMDPSHDPVEGMIGMEVLERFDVDFDFPARRIRLWKPRTVASAASKANMASINAVVVNETRLLGFRIVSASAPKDTTTSGGISAQPFLGVVDCGASFSVVNWAAAPLLGLPPRGDAYYKSATAVTGVGVDGRPQLLPTSEVSLSYCGNPTSETKLSFEAPPADWRAWSPVSLAVGDLPVFSQLLGDGRNAYRGPAGIIGLDVLTQRRVILETGAGRRRRIFVSK
eukprot:CAMPEP_0183745718 /NCGR_PEP_ID=MMETSP0737-20130205/66388_1 /TAXON_ID=385413 /ORGANISM="Thalassiosira miniscula, Strain CCMP1093" /LENGTH=471 /DNA_ID=CAMNT_0025981397 /DNA_START=119 /DNA_END=1537 /DNA_ORIENTATION=-